MGERILKMTFITESGAKATVRLRGIKEGLENTDIDTVMNLVITKNIFKFKGGVLVKKDSAVIEQTNTKKIEITA